MAAFNINDWIWVPHETERYLPAIVISPFAPGSDSGQVKFENGEEAALSVKESKQCHVMDQQSLEPIADMATLNHLDEPSLLHNLRIRFKADVIYTNVSTIVVAVNPFRRLPLYTPEILCSYIDRKEEELPPHVYAVADTAFKSLLKNQQSQSVIISGESGAGKTEATKQILQYLAEVSARAGGGDTARAESKTGSEEGTLEQKILQANPIMEAFGNSKTSRNNNSSRFGKWTNIVFTEKGCILGGTIVNYLLEKSRVVFQGEGERNYHIFYQFLAKSAADGSFAESMQLEESAVEAYQYLNQSSCTTIEGENELDLFDECRAAMNTLNMSPEHQHATFLCLSIILRLGNIEYRPSAANDDVSELCDIGAVEELAAILGSSSDALVLALTSRNIGTRSIIHVAYTVEQALAARDAMAKALYGNLFNWLIFQINKSIEPAGGGSTTGRSKLCVGVLDIFGFEFFESNSFEQLCINYCNEKLQFHFNNHVFKLEQDQYRAEGVDVSHIEFKDNGPCVEMLEAPRIGILALCDDQIMVPRGSDQGFLKEVNKHHGRHPALARVSRRVPDDLNCFAVVHFAATVAYNVNGFLEKNKDALSGDMRGIFTSSESEFLRSLFTPAVKKEPVKPRGGGRRGGRRGGKISSATLGKQFKAQLKDLMDSLNATKPNFIRCMKPNSAKVGGVFDANLIFGQLRYSGLLDVCRIRQLGYPVRKDFADFVARYEMAASLHNPLEVKRARSLADAEACATICHVLQDAAVLFEGEYALGNTKAFLRNSMESNLERARDDALQGHAIVLQKNAKRFLAVRQRREHKSILKNLQRTIGDRKRGGVELEQCLARSEFLPYGGQHLPLVQEATALLRHLQAEDKVLTNMEEGIENRDLGTLLGSVQAADELGFAPPEYEVARKLIAELEEEKLVCEQLRAAMTARDREQLSAILAHAEELRMATVEVEQATAVLAQLRDIAEVDMNLADAMEKRNPQLISSYLERVAELGVELDRVPEAKLLRDKLVLEDAFEADLQTAIAARNPSSLESVLTRAADKGLVPGEEAKFARPSLGGLLSQATDLLADLQSTSSAEAALAEASASSDPGALKQALAHAESIGMDPSAYPSVALAQDMLARLNRKAAALVELQQALARANDEGEAAAQSLATVLQAAIAAGLDSSDSDVTAAQSMLNSFGEKSAARDELCAALDSRELGALEAAMDKALAAGLDDTPDATTAKLLITRLQQEAEAVANLAFAISGRDLDGLIAALHAAASLHISEESCEAIGEAQQLRDRLKLEDQLSGQLRLAMDSESIGALSVAVASASEAGLSGLLFASAQQLLHECEEKRDALEAVSSATETQDVEQLRATLAQAAELGLDDDPTIRQAAIQLDRLEEVSSVRDQLQALSEAKDLNGLGIILARCTELGLTGDDVEAAQLLRSNLESQEEAEGKLRAALHSMTASGEGGADGKHLYQDTFARRRLSSAIMHARDAGLVEEVMQAETIKSLLKETEADAELIQTLTEQKEHEHEEVVLLEHNIEEVAAARDALALEKSDLEAALKTLNGDISQSTAEVARLSVEVEEHQATIEQLQEQARSSSDIISELRADKDTLTNSLQQLKTGAASTEESLTQRLADEAQRCANLTTELETARGQLSEQRQALALSESECNNLKTALEHLEIQHSTLMEASGESERNTVAELASSHEQLQEAKAQIGTLEVANKLSQQELASLRERLDEAKAAQLLLGQQQSEGASEISTLRSELATRVHELEQAHSDRDILQLEKQRAVEQAEQEVARRTDLENQLQESALKLVRLEERSAATVASSSIVGAEKNKATTELVEQLHASQQELHEVRHELTEELHHHNTAMDKLRAELDAKREDVHEVQRALLQAEQRVQLLEQKIEMDKKLFAAEKVSLRESVLREAMASEKEHIRQEYRNLSQQQQHRDRSGSSTPQCECSIQ